MVVEFLNLVNEPKNIEEYKKYESLNFAQNRSKIIISASETYLESSGMVDLLGNV